MDLAAYGRSDEKGIIITFYHTTAEYARNYNLTIQSLFSGYDTYSSGMIVVTDGKNVVASNDEKDVYKRQVTMLPMEEIMKSVEQYVKEGKIGFFTEEDTTEKTEPITIPVTKIRLKYYICLLYKSRCV